jgi:hypoxanthine-guanine phosphoribosyltransferase
MIAELVAMFLHGPTWMHRRFYQARQHLAVEALKGSAAFVTSLVAFVVAYYGLQNMEQSYGAALQTHATHVTAAQVEESLRPIRQQ